MLLSQISPDTHIDGVVRFKIKRSWKLTMKLNFLYGILFITACCMSEARPDPAAPALFDSHTVLKLSMKVDFKSLCRPRESEDCDYAPTELTYFAGDREHIIPVEIIVRGGWRSLASNCNVPLLFIRFPEQEIRGTPFEGQTSLPLTTHCGRSNALKGYAGGGNYTSYEQFLLKEYLAYRMYNEISDMSLQVRLVSIRYQDPEKPGRSKKFFAFFTEHFKSLAERSQTKLLPRRSFDHQALDTRQADILALFQFMIGNTDWSIVRQRNTILLQRDDGSQVPVPYDLDMSGLVNAPYAGPPPGLPIDTVKERYYLGFCHPGIEWDSLFQEFLPRQERLLSLGDEIEGLFKRERKSSERYVKKFFTILETPERRNDKIVEACHPWPPSPDDHMSPPELLSR